MAVDGETRDFLFVQTISQRHALEGARLLEQIAESLDVLRRDVDELTELGQQLFHVLDVLGNDLEGKGGRILRELHAVAVIDEPTRRRKRYELDPIVLGQGAETLVLHHLQLHHAQHQNPRQQQDAEAGRDYPASDDAGLAG